MKNIFLIATLSLMLLTQSLYAQKGKVRIGSNIQEAMIYANAKPKAMTGEGYTTLLLNEGTYNIKVEKITEDGEWIYSKTKKIFVGADTSTKINFELSKKATSKQESRLLEDRKKQVGLKVINGYIKPNMVLVKADNFKMGSNEIYEDPIHTVKIKKDFYISKYEVTFNEYDLYCDSTGKKKPNDSGYGRSFKPVININYNDAIAYIKWLNNKSGETYRLLTEEEWEYSARAGETGKWCFGSNMSTLKFYAWYNKNAYYKNKGTKYIGTKKPNLWGIYDMHGNVWELTSSWFSVDYNTKSIKKYKVRRGGCWAENENVSRSAYREGQKQLNSDSYTGFRLAKEIF